MKLVSLLLGFFSFTLALGSEASGILLQENEGTTAGASSIEYGIIKLVDRGRLTPFGRTYDIYLDTEGRVPSFLHAGRTWICDPDNDDGPFDTLGKENKDAWIEIENVGLHLITLTGYREPVNIPTVDGDIAILASETEKFYAHDDQMGPFSKLEFSGDANFPILTAWPIKNNFNNRRKAKVKFPNLKRAYQHQKRFFLY